MAFQLPAQLPGCRTMLAHWADLISSGCADGFKEQEILPDFLTDFFCGLLGYIRPADRLFGDGVGTGGSGQEFAGLFRSAKHAR